MAVTRDSRGNVVVSREVAALCRDVAASDSGPADTLSLAEELQHQLPGVIEDVRRVVDEEAEAEARELRRQLRRIGPR